MNLILLLVLLSLLCKIAAFCHMYKKASSKVLRFSDETECNGLDSTPDIRIIMRAAKLLEEKINMSNLFDSKSSLIALVKESVLKESPFYHAQDNNYEKLDKYLNHVYDIKIENFMKERQIKDDLLLEPMMTEIGDALKQHDLVQFVTNKDDIPKTYMTHKILNRLATSKGQIYIACSSMIDFELKLMKAKTKNNEIIASLTCIQHISRTRDTMEIEKFVQHYEPDVRLQKVLFYSQSLYSEENIPRINK